MKTPKSLYSRLTLITVLMVIMGYVVVYAWNTINSFEYQSGAPLTNLFLSKVVGNLDDLNGRVSNFSFSGGNVGIGTSDPQSKLHILSNMGGVGKDFRVSFKDAGTGALASGSSQGVAFTSNGNQTDYATLGIAGSNSQNAIGIDAWKTTGGAGSAANMVLNPSGGRVGIGTTTPTQKLDVNGAIAIHSVVTTSLIGRIQMEDNLVKIVLPAGKQWEMRDDGTIWFYDGISWTKKSL